MSFLDCINNGETEGKIRPDIAKDLRAAYTAAEDAYTDLFGAEAPLKAAQSVYGDMQLRLARKKRLRILAALTQGAIERDIRGFKDEFGRTDPYDGLRAMTDSAPFNAKRPGAYQRYEAIRGALHAQMREYIFKFERDLLGETRNKALLDDMVDELFGLDTGNANAKAVAKAWGETAESARRLFNAAGGEIAKRQDWGLPQRHDWYAVAEAGFENWYRKIVPLLDRPRMVDGLTGVELDDGQLREALEAAFDNITSEGWASREVTSVRAGRSMANRRNDHRFLVFKDGASWRAYQEEFGQDDPFKAMMGYIDEMSKDIALMQRFGPNPRAGLQYAQNLVERDAALSANVDAKTRAGAAARETETMFELMTGEANRPERVKFAKVSGNVRQILVGAQLGGAALSAVSDIGFGAVTAKFNGMSAMKVVKRQVELLSPTNDLDRQVSLRLELIADEAAGIMTGQQRYLGEVWGGNLPQKMSDAVLRVSGLSPWTQAGRWAFGMEFLGAYADRAGKAFDELPSPMQRQLKAYGFSKGDWDDIRTSALYEHKGAKFIDPAALRTRKDLQNGRGEDLALRLMSMLRTETNFAVPSVSLYGRAKVGGNLKPGTLPGELLRSTLMYKNFAITLATTHIRRTMRQATWRDKVRYGAALFLTTSTLGALSLQLKEIAKGRDPRPMTDVKFLMAAIAQGGGLGIFGDFLFTDVNRYGGGFEETVAGPVVGLMSDFARLTVGNGRQLLEGDDLADTNFGSEFTEFVGRYTPGTGIWWGATAFDRIVLDTMRDFTDPKASDRYRRVQRRYERDYGQDYWWKPGVKAPSRPPDLSNSVERR